MNTKTHGSKTERKLGSRKPRDKYTIPEHLENEELEFRHISRKKLEENGGYDERHYEPVIDVKAKGTKFQDVKGGRDSKTSEQKMRGNQIFRGDTVLAARPKEIGDKEKADRLAKEQRQLNAIKNPNVRSDKDIKQFESMLKVKGNIGSHRFNIDD